MNVIQLALMIKTVIKRKAHVIAVVAILVQNVMNAKMAIIETETNVSHVLAILLVLLRRYAIEKQVHAFVNRITLDSNAILALKVFTISHSV